jgi:transposase
VEDTGKSNRANAKSVSTNGGTKRVKTNFSFFVKTVKNHFQRIINSMKSLVTNALSEGLNSVFQLSKHRARGYRNVDNFMAMVYFLGNDFKFSFHSK